MLEAISQQMPARMIFGHGPNRSFRVHGPDTWDWLDRMLTADVRAPGRQALRSLCLDRLGKIHGEVLCWVDRDASDIVLTGGDLGELMEHLKRHVIMEDVEIDLTAQCLYSCHGQDAEDTAALVASVEGVRAERLSWLTSMDRIWLVPAARESEWLDCAARSGIAIGGLDQWEALRIAAGVPQLGQDYTTSDTPSVAGLVGELVSQTKGCYLGQEVVCRTVMRGSVREQVARLKFVHAPPVGAKIQLASTGEAVGTVTSASQSLGGGWALGRVKTRALESNADLMAAGIEGQCFARGDSA